MSLSNELISQFVKTTKDDSSDKQKDSKLFGTIVEYGGDKYVRLDGSDLLTPISTTTDVSNDERVTVEIKNHAAIVTGNLTAPSAKKEDLDDAVDQISDFEIVIADKVDTDELNAEIGRIDDLISDTITANEGRFEDLEADNLQINEKLTATDAAIENLEATKLDAEIADLTYATIENLDATNANIYNLSAAYGEFEDLTTEKFIAFDAAINDLETNKLSAVDADLKYANIDFSNIGEAAIEELFSKSGIIEDLVVSEGHITGQLVGVTISGDLIEGNTIKADKLVVLGSDGLYYKLNVNAETVATEQTEYNSLNGSIITANTITAEKINVDDLVAFNATIGGFKITNSAIYSGVKSSIDNSTNGVYLDKDGQISIGNSNQFVTFYKDAETNTYKLAISAGSGNNYIRAYEDENGDFKVQISASQIKLGAGDKDLEESLAETIKSTVEEFYLSDSPTELLNGSWSDTQPTWTEGKYIWRRTKVTYGNNTVDYTPSTTGVCITGNPGSSGSGMIIAELSTSGQGMFDISYNKWIYLSTADINEWIQVGYGKYYNNFNEFKKSSIVLINGVVTDYGDVPASIQVEVLGVFTNAEEYVDFAIESGMAPPGYEPTEEDLVGIQEMLDSQGGLAIFKPITLNIFGMPGQDGQDGQPGEPGRGILKSTNYYYISDQSEGVEFPFKDANPNLISNSSFSENFDGWQTRILFPKKDKTEITITENSNIYCARMSINCNSEMLSDSDTTIYNNISSIKKVDNLSKYTLSGYFKAENITPILYNETLKYSLSIPIKNEYSKSALGINIDIPYEDSEPNWVYLSNSITIKYEDGYSYNDDDNILVSVREFGMKSGNLYFHSLKLEEGSEATPWTPSLEESGWSTTPLLTDAVNKYLWNAEVIEYTDGTKETIGPMVIGTHGADGTPGAAGTSTYFHVAYSNSEDGLTDFSTTDPTNRKYIGTYVDEIQLDSTDPTDYVWMLVKGADGQNGLPGTDGEDGITYYLHIAYANSADGQINFSTTEAEGRTYLGQCVDTNETDPSTSESYTWSLIKGNDGKGITNIIEYYAVSSDPNTEPTEWFETVPTMSETNRYLWNYEKTVYSDSSETTSNKRIIGVYGEVGSPGRGIESIVNYYLASEESSGVTTETEGWTTTIQNTDSVKKYLWNYERIEYTDDTFTTVGPRIIGTHGKGIESTEIKYQVSDSQTELPTGEWTETIPNTTTAKPYLWTRTVITYTDDSTSTSYSVSSTMDSIEVGATNLQRNSEFKDQLNYWSITSEEYISIDKTLTYEGSNVLKFSRPVDDVDGGSIYFQTNYATNSIPGKAGDTFSISAYFYTEDTTETNINGPVYLILWTSDTDGGNDVNVIQKEINFESGKWVRETLTGTLTQDAQSVTFVIRMSEDGTFYMAKPKLERGNQVTDWSPAPEDLDFSDAIGETNSALEDLDNALTEEITETRAELEILSDSISTLVVDENGESMMTQTGDGWVFSMGNTITDLNAAKENIDTLGQTVTNHDADIHNIEASIGDLQEIASYIRINSDGDVPFIELGNTTSDFKLKITNSDIQFIDGTEMPAHITNQMLKISTAEVEDKLIFGGFAFAERSNGNMGLFWKGSD